MKKIINFLGDEMTIYTPKDVDGNFLNIVTQAKDMWKKICEENFVKYGDEGSCVVGAGISIYFIPPRCRNYRRSYIIRADDVTNCQGSLSWERDIEKVIEYLKNNGIDCHYNGGRMD